MTGLEIPATAAEIAARLAGRLVGDGRRTLGRPAPLESAGAGDFSFLDAGRPAAAASGCRAGVLFAATEIADCAATQILVAEPRRAFFALVAAALEEARIAHRSGRAASAVVHRDARVAADARLDDHVSVGRQSEVGPGVRLHAGVVVGEDCRIGANTVVHANVSIRDGTIIGERVVIHDGSVIGADGFGYEPAAGGLVKVPQIGIVVIEDEVEIGANVCIDRATLGETRIGRGTKIDNLVQIAHNVVIGPHSVIVSQVGISGSTRLGRGVMIGGQAGLVGHLEIGDGARIGAQSGVGHDLEAGQEVLGSPAYDKRLALRTATILPRLPELRRRLQDLERRLAALEDQSDSGTSSRP